MNQIERSEFEVKSVPTSLESARRTAKRAAGHAPDSFTKSGVPPRVVAGSVSRHSEKLELEHVSVELERVFGDVVVTESGFFGELAPWPDDAKVGAE
jgi:hypothetical protein